MSIPIVILASGRGSNFDAIIAAKDRGALDVEIRAVISDRPDSLVLSKARGAGIPSIALPFPHSSQGPMEARRKAHGDLILEALSAYQPRFLVLAGYMRLLPQHVIESFRSERGYSRIVNIHPSLLPSFPGKESYVQAYQYGAKMAGVTVHLVDDQMDNGPICAQESFRIDDCEHEREVEARGRKVEHRLYPETLRWVLIERFEVSERIVKLQDNTTVSQTRRICVRPS